MKKNHLLPYKKQEQCSKIQPLCCVSREIFLNINRETAQTLNKSVEIRDKQSLADSDITNMRISLKSNLTMLRFEKSKINGWGVFNTQKLHVGEAIIEFIGDIYDLRTGLKRFKLANPNKMMMFSIDESHFIDIENSYGIFRFINHSCEPNCNLRLLKRRGYEICVLYASTEIEPYTELLIDYSIPNGEKIPHIPCACKSDFCRGSLNRLEAEQIVIIKENVVPKIVPPKKVKKEKKSAPFVPVIETKPESPPVLPTKKKVANGQISEDDIPQSCFSSVHEKLPVMDPSLLSSFIRTCSSK